MKKRMRDVLEIMKREQCKTLRGMGIRSVRKPAHNSDAINAVHPSSLILYPFFVDPLLLFESSGYFRR
jgi:hypothetical protein